MPSYLVCFFHVTDFVSCGWVECRKCPPTAGRVPFIVNKNLWKVGSVWNDFGSCRIQVTKSKHNRVNATDPTCSSCTWLQSRAPLPLCA